MRPIEGSIHPKGASIPGPVGRNSQSADESSAIRTDDFGAPERADCSGLANGLRFERIEMVNT